ncbi:hypothetical protein JDV02_000483 [Purpureocillium takamizusanense]|nr:uncharacterized protein JDV02_000483 [Purpureocillium takamizusanense]UNI13773.1 hypothetical protein JDV02_000483 [Purpureocillium takamizusanense]
MKLYYAAGLLYIVAICGSKSAMFLLMARLTRQSQHISLVVSYGATCFTVVWMVVSLFVVGFQCGLPNPWDMVSHEGCRSTFTRWAVVEIFSILIEVMISAMAVALVWDLKMAVKVKVAVVGAFSAQLLVIVPIIFRLMSVRRSLDSSDITFDWTETTLTTQVVMHFSLMAATFPCFRQFLQAFDSGFGATTKMETQTGGSGSRTNNSYALQSLGSKKGGGEETATGANGGRGGGGGGVGSGSGRPMGGQGGAALGCNTSASSSNSRAMARLRPDRTAEIVTQATADGPDRAGDEDRSIESVGSDKAIIWRTREFEVHYDEREREG